MPGITFRISLFIMPLTFKCYGFEMQKGITFQEKCLKFCKVEKFVNIAPMHFGKKGSNKTVLKLKLHKFCAIKVVCTFIINLELTENC